jgi:hypothetical protein
VVVVKLLLAAGAQVRPNNTCVDPCGADAVKANGPLLALLTKHKALEEHQREQDRWERERAQNRAAEHRRRLALKLAGNGSC